MNALNHLKLSRRLFFVSVVATFPLVSGAEIPPTPAEVIQSNAPEAVTIQIQNVVSNRMGITPLGAGDKSFEKVEATVISVARTASGLEAGDKIVITYVHEPLDGLPIEPKPLPRLAKAGTYSAWLSESAKGRFEPAAGGFSFADVE